MSRLLPLSALLLAACPADPVDDVPDTAPDTDGLITVCDADEDGSIADYCGGPDCNDGDPQIHPRAWERVGDDIDQDCDGRLDIGVDMVIPQPHEVIGGWSWSPDLWALGGTVRSRSGVVGSQRIDIDLVTTSGAWSGQSDFIVDLGELVGMAHRVWTPDGGLDVFQIEEDGAHALVAWEEGDLRVLQLGAGPASPWLHAMVDDTLLSMVTCGDDDVVFRALILDQGLTNTERLGSPADRCLVVGPSDQPQIIVGTHEPGPVTRYRMGPGGFTDATQLAPSIGFDPVAASTQGDDAVFAFGSGGQVYLFDVDAAGAILDAEGTVVQLAVDTDGFGGFAIAWTTEEGVLHLAWGELGQTPARTTFDVLDPDTPLAVGVDEVSLVAGWIEDDAWMIARARLEPIAE